ANISIAGAAAVGARNVSVTTPGGTGTLPNGFTVNAAPATQKLIGSGSVSADTTEAPNYFCLSKFTAEATGAVTEIKIYCGGACNVKIGMYQNNGGEPGALLNAINTSQACVAGWNTIAFPSTAVTSGTDYWLAFNSNAHQVAFHYATVQRRYKVATYSSFSFPNPAGSGLTSDSVGYYMFAGWGTIVPPTPPPTPTTLPPAMPITFSWSASAGATKYQLQVNTNSTFSGTSLFDSEVTATTQVVAVPIGTTCYWHVRAGNAGGWSDWSPTGTVIP
ncbi:MAG: hypothetical protein WCD72_04570, partial [Dehalococcoidia bacterium]